MSRRSLALHAITCAVGLCAALAVPASASGSHASARAASARVSAVAQRPSPVLEISQGCKGQNAEVESAVTYPYVYEVWIGCGGIGFARSANGGKSFGRPVQVPGSAGSGYAPTSGGRELPKFGWDPAIAVAQDGTLYVSYMIFRNGYAHPRIAISYNRGASFSRVSQVMPPAPDRGNWGDRDFIAVAPDDTIYVTWDFTPSAKLAAANIVIQKSTDGGRTWSAVTPVSPGYPDRGSDPAGPLLTLAGGRIDVLLWTDDDPGVRYALPPGHDYFTTSGDGGRTWSRPIAVGPHVGTDGSQFTGWIDTNIGIDASGTLYATWDTQQPGGDIGWLCYSTDSGRTWSRAIRVTPDHDHAEHIMAVIGGAPGTAYVGWLTGGPYFGVPKPPGFAQYLRMFSVRQGWLSPPERVSLQDGNGHVWPGDTIGISLLPGRRIMLSWGSAIGGKTSQIWARQVQPAA